MVRVGSQSSVCRGCLPARIVIFTIRAISIRTVGVSGRGLSLFPEKWRVLGSCQRLGPTARPSSHLRAV